MDISNRLIFDKVFVFFGICDSSLTLSTLCPSNDLLLDIKLYTVVPETSYSKTLNYNNNITNSNK